MLSGVFFLEKQKKYWNIKTSFETPETLIYILFAAINGDRTSYFVILWIVKQLLDRFQYFTMFINIFLTARQQSSREWTLYLGQNTQEILEDSNKLEEAVENFQVFLFHNYSARIFNFSLFQVLDCIFDGNKVWARLELKQHNKV